MARIEVRPTEENLENDNSEMDGKGDKDVEKTTEVEVSYGCGPLRFLRRAMNEGFDKRLLTTMKVTLSMGEFCLLLLVLVVLLEISPADIPKACPRGLHETCLKELISVGGADALEIDDNSKTCGVLRVDCWRGSAKNILYDTGNVANKKTVNISALGLDSVILDGLGPRLAYCTCLLTLDGTVPFPPEVDSWRSDTDFFCDTLNTVNQGVGALGFFVGTALVLFKSTLDDLGEDAEKRISSHLCMWLLLFAIIWVGWNAALVYATKDFGWGSGQTIDCELPEAQMFYYVFNIALLSNVAGVFFFICMVLFYFGCTLGGPGCLPKWRNTKKMRETMSKSL
eukprot:m.312952 g.312952  ORF g.312952 m.312952 type:complete len:340 (+) comp16484_c0_seq63:65-1084(+)